MYGVGDERLFYNLFVDDSLVLIYSPEASWLMWLAFILFTVHLSLLDLHPAKNSSAARVSNNGYIYCN